VWDFAVEVTWLGEATVGLGPAFDGAWFVASRDAAYRQLKESRKHKQDISFRREAVALDSQTRKTLTRIERQILKTLTQARS
jgi:hypothetical protein